MVQCHTYTIAMRGGYFVKVFDAVAEDTGKGMQPFMGLCLNSLAAIKTVCQFPGWDKTFISSNALVWAKAAALLNHVTGRYRVQLSPRTGTRRCTVDGLDVGTTRSQRREVDANATATSHDLGHHFQVIQNTLATVFWTRDHKTVIICHLVARTGSRENTTTGHKLKLCQRIIKLLLPLGSFLICCLYGGNTACNACPQVFGIELQGIPRGILQRIPIHKDLLANTVQFRGLLGVGTFLVL